MNDEQPRLPFVRFVVGESNIANNTGANFCCPVCGIDYVHPAQVVVEQGRTRTEISNESTLVTASSHGLQHRGSRIELQFFCESGHSFRYLLSFHKGNLHCELEAWETEADEYAKQLWRD